jgi:hypothetical protein
MCEQKALAACEAQPEHEVRSVLGSSGIVTTSFERPVGRDPRLADSDRANFAEQHCRKNGQVLTGAVVVASPADCDGVRCRSTLSFACEAVETVTRDRPDEAMCQYQARQKCKP